MTLISSITNEEVVTQTLKIIDVFGSLNEKVNTMFSQKLFEDAVTTNDSISFSENLPIDEKKNTTQNKKKIDEERTIFLLKILMFVLRRKKTFV